MYFAIKDHPKDDNNDLLMVRNFFLVVYRYNGMQPLILCIRHGEIFWQQIHCSTMYNLSN